MEILSKAEKKALVIKLYKEGKTYKEIAEIVRISPRDIGRIINEYTGEKTTICSKSNSAKGYYLLLKGKTPIQMAIKLNLPFEEARKVTLEYWNLQGLTTAEVISKEYKNYMPQILQLIDIIKTGQISTEDFNKFCQYIGDIPSLEHRRNELLHRNNIFTINTGESVE